MGAEHTTAKTQDILQTLEWRCIGPHRGGRVVAVAGDPSDPAVFYFGACAGGVWKTTDGGTYWENISDGFFQTAAVGALAVADSDPNVIYAGMGEACIRVDVSHGDGVYRSTDAGKTWEHVGLNDTRHIARIRIHPHNPDLVYVAALGHIYGPNRERGIFRSQDGGKSWEQVLFRSEKAGAADLSLHPQNPRLLYAALWQVQRFPWSLESGGPESSLYKSTDGGDSWIELTSNPGLPTGIKGRIGVAVSPARPDRVWAIIEAEEGGLFRSDDGGATWERLSTDRNLLTRPWYYSHIFAHPQDPDTLYVLNVQCWKSTDGGRTFTEIPTPHGDNHDLWIDPRNPQRMIEGNDGGACVSFNGGDSWSTIYNQPTAQFYHVATDNQFPYRVYGTQQDNTAISVPSRSYKGAILWTDCYPVGSAESGHIVVHPQDPNLVYSGAIGSAPGGGGVLLRYDHRTGQVRIITVWPEIYGGWGAKDLKYRFQWTFPILISPHDPQVLYTAGNLVFRSTDEGTSWEAISPDLTRNDVSKMEPSGGPITKDTTGAEHYGTIFAFVESPHEAGVFWAGSDDGLIHLSRDGGQTWENVTPPDLPAWTLISMIEPSPHDPATVYVAATRYRLDDFRPYLYKTNDYGKTWTRITSGIPAHDFTRVIREDPARRGLLYAGTETGVYISFDDGASWQSLQRNLPVVPIYDLVVKDNDLIAATHGRSFWILDDLTPLHQLNEQVTRSPLHLFSPRPAYRFPPPIGSGRPGGPGKNYRLASGVPATFYERKTPEGETVRDLLDAGQNPPDGVIITYYLREEPEGEVTLTFRDAQGEIIKRFSSQADTQEDSHGPQEPRVPARAGMNR
ncbi:MAG: glycosyl hydrolase, partial [Nitrospinota bacterium]